jgi:hypothetical protein
MNYNIHETAKRAMETLRERSDNFQSDLCECNERQFVHELGIELRQQFPSAAICLEQRLYDTNSKEGAWLSEKRADIHVISKEQPREFAWVEVKYTGVSPGSRGNSIMDIWNDDLLELDYLWLKAPGTTRCDFIWCHLIETHAPQLKAFAKQEGWTKPMTLKEASDGFGGHRNIDHGTISACLSKLAERVKSMSADSKANLSILPRLARAPNYGDTPYHVLLTTISMPKR